MMPSDASDSCTPDCFSFSSEDWGEEFFYEDVFSCFFCGQNDMFKLVISILLNCNIFTSIYIVIFVVYLWRSVNLLRLQILNKEYIKRIIMYNSYNENSLYVTILNGKTEKYYNSFSAHFNLF